MSWAVTGWPSCHFASLRIVKVQTRPSGDSVHDDASPGAAERFALSKFSSMSKFKEITSYSCDVSAFHGLTVLMSAIVPSTKVIGWLLTDPDALLEELALCASAVPANDIARRMPSAAKTTTARRPLLITCLLSMGPSLLPLVLRASVHPGFVDRQRPGICVQGRGDPERDGREMFPVTERQLV